MNCKEKEIGYVQFKIRKIGQRTREQKVIDYFQKQLQLLINS